MLSGAETAVLSNLLQNVTGELVAHVLESLGGRALRERADRRRIEQEAKAISDRLAEQLREAGMRDNPRISIEDWEAALLRLGTVIGSARATGMDPVLASAMRPDRLAAILTEHGARTDAFPVTSGARQAYEWLLGAVSPLIIAEFERRPDADTQLIKAVLQFVVVIRETLDTLMRTPQPVERVIVIREPPAIEPPAEPPFEPRYLDHVARTYGRFELFGVNRGREPSKQSFDECYISPTVARTSDPDGGSPGEEEEEEPDPRGDRRTGPAPQPPRARPARPRLPVRRVGGRAIPTLRHPSDPDVAVIQAHNYAIPLNSAASTPRPESAS